MPTPREIIKMEYGDSKNLMTPKILEYGRISGDIVYEFSQGEGICHEPVYGVTVVKYNPETKTTERMYDLTNLFYTYREAKGYIKWLKKKFAKEKAKQIA